MAKARLYFQALQKRNARRQPYVRSKFFYGDKVFINIYWNHLVQKRKSEQLKRSRLLPAALDLLRNATISPTILQNYSDKQHKYFRFKGRTKDGTIFYVQVRQNLRTDRKDFMSAFMAKGYK